MSFPATHVSLLGRVRSTDAETRARAQEALAAVYWTPIYSHVRLTHRQEPADAEDLTQGFFADAMRRDLFARYDPARARFRTYVRRCVDSYVANALQAERRQKRGGALTFVSLDTADAERRLTTTPDLEAEAAFEREWARSIFETALARLRHHYRDTGRIMPLTMLEAYDLVDDDVRPSYAQLATEHSVPVTRVTNWLAAARRDFRSHALETIRELTSSDEEFRDEVRALLGRALS